MFLPPNILQCRVKWSLSFSGGFWKKSLGDKISCFTFQLNWSFVSWLHFSVVFLLHGTFYVSRWTQYLHCALYVGGQYVCVCVWVTIAFTYNAPLSLLRHSFVSYCITGEWIANDFAFYCMQGIELVELNFLYPFSRCLFFVRCDAEKYVAKGWSGLN